jgi:Protein of unknown function (DUF2934)
MARMIPLYSVSSQAEIERRARELFELRGRPAGCDLDHWLQAEADYLEVLRHSPASLPRAGAWRTLSSPA